MYFSYYFSLYPDDISMQLIALKVLSTALGNGNQSLCYIYEQYEVSQSLFMGYSS